jgi:hypothetical protein
MVTESDNCCLSLTGFLLHVAHVLMLNKQNQTTVICFQTKDFNLF